VVTPARRRTSALIGDARRQAGHPHSVPEQQNEDDDRDRNPEQPKKNSTAHIGSPRL
jgi:hypothetical protein